MAKQLAFQLRLFFTAYMFFTRLPAPAWVGFSSEMLQKSARYFPWVGILVGGIGAGVFVVAHALFAQPIALVLSMAATVWVTGAFHEDGFADLCDGFGGGWTREQVLTIMKDSRLGTFGAVGLGLLMALKFVALLEIEPSLVPLALIAGHSASRGMAVTFLYTHDYVQRDQQSKAKPLATSISAGELAIAAVGALAPLLLGDLRFVAALVPMGIARWLLGRLFARVLGGYTGDCLGAAQQMTEVIFYLVIGATFWP
jgi:adenosylcobinamide-GDP ribazoletransferase